LCGKDGGEDISSDIYRNRAHVNLLLSRFDEAKADGLASVTGSKDEKGRLLDSKAKFRAGSAAYSLGQYEEAQRLFKEALELSPEDKDTSTYLRSIDVRLQEQNTGNFNFTKIRSKLSKARPRVDTATYVGNVEVRDSALGGRGMFAKQDIKAGELILCEKAFCVAWGHEEESWTAMTYDARDDRIRAYPAGLTKVIVQKLLNNPSQIEKVMSLYSDWRSIGKDTLIGEDGPVVDTFQVHDIVCRNAFGPGPVLPNETENIRKASTGLWVMAAYINHSCLANAVKDHIGDLLLIRATRDISAGEEVTHQYDSATDYAERQEALKRTWGFECQCSLCKAESEDTVETRKKRKDLELQALAAMSREPPNRAKRTTVLKLERWAKSIRETYDEARYKGLPRTALLQVEGWLKQAQR
jgi:tetratricopeptide (TPR) repeat protein